MKTTELIVAVLIVAALLSACTGGPTTINQAAPPPVRSITVSGLGEVSITPDIASIYLGVHTEDASASAAVAANNVKTQEVIEALTAFGIDAKDIRTSNFSIWPSQSYSPEGLPLETRYVVDNTVYLTVRDLETLGELLDTVISAGVNTVNSIQFDVADKKEALKEARAAAVKNAQEQAAELAAAAGVELGEVMSVNYYDSVPYPMFEGKGGGGAADAAVPIQPGQLTLTVTVSMTYEIK